MWGYSGAGTPFEWPEAVGFGQAPYASLVSGAWHCVAGPNGVAVGCFGWADIDNTGQVNNAWAPNLPFGIVLPMAGRYNLWEKVYIRYGLPFPQMIIRPGVRCIVAAAGDFKLKFPQGGQVGTQVYADAGTGLPLSGAPVSSTIVTGASYEITTGSGSPLATSSPLVVPTKWTLTQSGRPNAGLKVSSFISPFA